MEAARHALGVAAVAAGIGQDNRHCWVATADGAVHPFSLMDCQRRAGLAAHRGVTLCLVADRTGTGMLSGGDDGRLLRLGPDGATELARHAGRWVEHIDSTDTTICYAVGRDVLRCDAAGAVLEPLGPHPSTVGGLAISPNGRRLAVSHYDGLSLWWLNADAGAPVRLRWKGSHLNVIWHPDGKHVLSSMQEPALHGWRLTDMNEMRMSGYVRKVRSLAFSPKGRWLWTAGAEQPIGWPFFGGGPWGKSPQALDDPGLPISHIAPSPAHEMIVAAADERGRIIMSLGPDQLPLMLQDSGPPLVALLWDADGQVLVAVDNIGSVVFYTATSIRSGFDK